jgi:hypothetical protein
MSIREQIRPYTDGNDLVAPNLVTPNALSGSDNGPMFTSEYFIILCKSGQLLTSDIADFSQRIEKCINSQGMLNRVPVGQSDGQEGPDDYYGVLNACFHLGVTSIPRKFLWATIKYKGALNNVNPGTWQWDTVLIRQPQLLAAMVCAAFPKWNPLHILIRLIALPLFLIAAVSLAISCTDTPNNEADPRRLSWHLLQTVYKRSIMCKLASFIWYWRLRSDYKEAEMRGVAYLYYQRGHPFIQYWVS